MMIDLFLVCIIGIRPDAPCPPPPQPPTEQLVGLPAKEIDFVEERGKIKNPLYPQGDKSVVQDFQYPQPTVQRPPKPVGQSFDYNRRGNRNK